MGENNNRGVQGKRLFSTAAHIENKTIYLSYLKINIL